MTQHIEPQKNETLTSPFDTIKNTRPDGSEYWSARDLMPLMAYAQWQNFMVPLDRAMATAKNQGMNVENLFMRSHEKTAGRPREDFHLVRYAAYLVAMNGDPNIPEVAAAQHYFAVRTREAETQPELSGKQLMAAALIEAQETMHELEATTQRQAEEIAAAAPAVEYHDNFVTDEDFLYFSAVASTLGIQESELRGLLVAHKWIYVESYSRWSETQNKKIHRYRYTEYAHKKPYFHRAQNHRVPRFMGTVMHTLMITPAGASAIRRAVEKWMKPDQEELDLGDPNAA